MIDKVISESKKTQNRSAICVKCWVWILRPQDKRHQGKKRKNKGINFIFFNELLRL